MSLLTLWECRHQPPERLKKEVQLRLAAAPPDVQPTRRYPPLNAVAPLTRVCLQSAKKKSVKMKLGDQLAMYYNEEASWQNAPALVAVDRFV